MSDRTDASDDDELHLKAIKLVKDKLWPEQLRKEAEEALQSEIAAKARAALEHAGKVNRLTIRQFHIDPANPLESPDIRCIGELYAANMLPPQVIVDAKDGNEQGIIDLMHSRGELMKRWKPTALERGAHLRDNPQFLSAREQMARELYAEQMKDAAGRLTAGAEDVCPGDLLCFGMQTPEGELVGYISLYLPPRDPARNPAYITSLKKRFLSQSVDSKEFSYDVGQPWDLDRWEQTIEEGLGEIDLVIVRKGYGGTVYRLLDAAFATMQQRGYVLPRELFYYRVHGLRVMDEHGQQLVHLPCSNGRTQQVADSLGCHEFGSSARRSELLHLESGGRVLLVVPSWRYGTKSTAGLRRMLGTRMGERGLQPATFVS